jgi:hypothetical protein
MSSVSGAITTAHDFLINPIPTDAEIRYDVTTFIENRTERKSYLAKITFTFAGIDREKKKKLGFAVNGIKIYKTT